MGNYVLALSQTIMQQGNHQGGDSQSGDVVPPNMLMIKIFCNGVRVGHGMVLIYRYRMQGIEKGSLLPVGAVN